MDFTQLKYFQVVAKTENISKAAEKLYLSQPNLSRAISRLEKELGVPLFERRSGRIYLNEYGRTFLLSVNAAFSELSSATQLIQRQYKNSNGVLSVACTIDDFLPDVLKDFHPNFPNITIKQFNYSFIQILDHLLDNSLDFAISSFPINHKNISFNILEQNEFVIFLNEKHPLASKDKISITDLSQERIICNNSRLNLETLRNICLKHGFEPMVAYEVEASDLVCSLLESNAGIAFMPLAHFKKIVNNNPQSKIIIKHINENIAPPIIGIAHHRTKPLCKPAKILINFIEDWLAEKAEMST